MEIMAETQAQASWSDHSFIATLGTPKPSLEGLWHIISPTVYFENFNSKLLGPSYFRNSIAKDIRQWNLEDRILLQHMDDTVICYST